MNVPGCFYKFDCWIGLKGRERGVGAAVFLVKHSLTISAKGRAKRRSGPRQMSGTKGKCRGGGPSLSNRKVHFGKVFSFHICQILVHKSEAFYYS